MRQAWPAMFLLLLGSSAASAQRPCAWRICAANISRTRWASTNGAAAELDAPVRPPRPAADGLPGLGRVLAGVARPGSRRPLGQRPRGLRRDGPGGLRRQDAGVAPGVFLESAGVGPRRQTERLEPTGPLGIGPAAARRLDGPLDRGRPEGRSGRRRRVACGRPVDLVSRARGQSQGQGGARRPLLPPAPERPGRGETGVCVAGRRRRSRFHPVPQRQKTGSRRRRAELAIAAAIRREGVAYPRRQRAGGHGCAEV